MKNKEVLLIRNNYPDSFGGGEIYQLQIAEELRLNGIKPIIITSCKKLLTEAKKNGFEAIGAPYNKRQNWSGKKIALLPAYWVWQKRLTKWYLRIFKEHSDASINIQSRDDWIAATKAAKRLGMRIVWTDHADFRNWVLQNVDVWYKNSIGKKILRCAKDVSKIIFISQYDYNYFKKLKSTANLNNCTVIKNGVIDKYKKTTSSKTGHKICFIGRLEPAKGAPELIDAFVEVRKEIPDAELELYGEGSLYKQKKIDGVRYNGYVEDIYSALENADIFVLPSHMEGLSLSLIEAAMMGKAIIATKVGGTPEIIQDRQNGILVEPGDVDGLTSALSTLLCDKKIRDKYGANARKTYLEHFELKKNSAKLIKELFN
jgi:glycosyltransferase involved in cell wall biosynthesis